MEKGGRLELQREGRPSWSVNTVSIQVAIEYRVVRTYRWWLARGALMRRSAILAAFEHYCEVEGTCANSEALVSSS